MADERRRRIEREWAGGDPAAGARLLLERVRTGDLARDRLELAAYAGHPAARLARGPTPRPDPEAMEPWVRGLGKWGEDVLDCAQDAAVRMALGVLPTSSDADHEASVRDYEAMANAAFGTSEFQVMSRFLTLYAAGLPDASNSAAEICAWFLMSRTLSARQYVPAATEYSRALAEHVVALAAALGDAVFAEMRTDVIALALR